MIELEAKERAVMDPSRDSAAEVQTGSVLVPFVPARRTGEVIRGAKRAIAIEPDDPGVLYNVACFYA